MSTMTDPTGGVLLDMVKAFEVNRNTAFRSIIRLDSGNVQLAYSESDATKVKEAGLTVPTQLTLVLHPFEGNTARTVYVRLRYHLQDAALRLGVKIIEPERVRREAFLDLVTDVQARVNVPVIEGQVVGKFIPEHV